jgi:hypothetical protein
MLTTNRAVRECVYSEDLVGASHEPSQQPLQPRQPSHDVAASSQQMQSPALSLAVHGVFNHSFGALNQENMCYAVNSELLKILGSFDAIQEVSLKYFNGTWKRLAIISQRRFNEHLPSVSSAMPVGFGLLVLCMYLIEQRPPKDAVSMTMRNPLYVMIKALLSISAAIHQYKTVEFLQCQLLLTFYEIGHDMDNASLTIASCTKLGRVLKLHMREFRQIITTDNELLRDQLEEKKRVWWAIRNLERYLRHGLLQLV